MNDVVSCFHCGEPNRAGDKYRVTILGEPRAMCCPGCQAVAETIVTAGLDAYYQQRFACATTPDAAELEQVLAQADNLTSAELEQPWVRQAGEQVEAVMHVEGITCAACGWLIERHLQAQPGIVSARLNVSTHELLVRWQDGVRSLADMVRQLATLGYRARVRRPDDLLARFRRERKTALGRLAVAGLSAMQAMMYAVGLYFGGGRDMEPAIEAFLRWTSLIVAIPVVTYAAWPFHSAAWRALRSRQLVMDVPVSLAITLAFVASLVATFGHTGEVYFESVTMFIFFISIGRFLEMLVRHRAAARNDRLSRFAPTSALRLGEEGEQRVPLSALRENDRVLVKPGATVPADGLVVTGCSSTNESFLTGESLPQEKAIGSRVLAGSINGGSPLTITVTATGASTVFAGIQHLQSLAQSRKPYLAKVADRLAGWFVAGLLVVALAVLMAWLTIDPARAVWVLIAVLVATCPCALTLATSAASAASGSALASTGFYLTGDSGLETLASVTDVVFDKTGTLTDGNWQLERVLPLRAGVSADQALATAAALERHSEHPLAQAFAHVVISHYVDEVHAVPGHGLAGALNQRTYKLGRADFAWPLQKLTPPDISQGQQCHSAILLADDTGPIAWFFLQEQIRPTAQEAVQRLRALGVDVHLASGDQLRAVARVAGALGIVHWQSDCTPDVKLTYVEELQDMGRKVMMVGDGVNDSPVMGAAHLGVAMSSGADLARQSADAVLLGGDLRLLAASLIHARKTLRIIKQNLLWALAYNLCVLPLAVTGWLTPWMAAAGMSASSLLVVLNALRLNRLDTRSQGAADEHHFSADPSQPGTAGPGRSRVLLGHET